MMDRRKRRLILRYNSLEIMLSIFMDDMSSIETPTSFRVHLSCWLRLSYETFRIFLEMSIAKAKQKVKA
jgi:hypothetical protein